MKYYFSLFLILVCTIHNTKLFSQTSFSIHAGPTIILQDYNGMVVNFNEIGMNLGVEYQAPVVNDRCKLFVDFDYLFNKYNMTQPYQYYGTKTPSKNSISISQFPLTIGLSCSAPIYEETEFFVAGGFGGKVEIVPEFSYKYNNNTYKEKSDVLCNYCAKLKAGFSVNDEYNLSINYIYFFSKNSTPAYDFMNSSISPMVSVTLGFGF